MPPTTPKIRTNTKKRLMELITAAVPARPGDTAVQIRLGWPGRDMEHECIWIGRAEGAPIVPTMKAGRKRVHDEFRVDIWVVAGTPGQIDPEKAEERCEELVGYVRDIVADDPHLGDLEGLRGGAQVSQIDGPESEPTDEGTTAIARVEVTAKTSIS